MNTKKIVFYIMCLILAAMIIVTCITIGKAGALVGSILNPAPPATNPPVSTTAGTEGQTEGTEPPETDAPITGTVDSSHQHSYEAQQPVPPTCIEEGYTLYKCSCGDIQPDDIVPALGHSYGVGKVVTACVGEDVCYTQYECSRCDHVDKRNVTDGTGHKFEIAEEIPATCTEDARIVRKCSNPNCSETKTSTTPNTAIGKHDFSDWALSGDGMKTECEREGCSVSVHSSELKITDESIEGSTYIVIVGTSDENLPRIKYTINDNRSEGEQEANKLTYRFLPQSGLVVSYTDSHGIGQETPLGFKDNTLTIDE